MPSKSEMEKKAKHAAEEAKDAAAHLADSAAEQAKAAQQKASDMLSDAGKATGGLLRDGASGLRDVTAGTPASGIGDQIAGGLDKAGRRLQGRKSALVRLAEWAQRNPLLVAAIVTVLVFMLTSGLRRRA